MNHFIVCLQTKNKLNCSNLYSFAFNFVLKLQLAKLKFRDPNYVRKPNDHVNKVLVDEFKTEHDNTF